MAVEHHPALSDGLVALITSQPDMEVVGTASNAEEVRKRLVETRPDVTIVDADMPHGMGLQVIREIRRDQPNVAIIALVSYEWDSFALEAVDVGALAFLPKDRISERLLDLIRSSGPW